MVKNSIIIFLILVIIVGAVILLPQVQFDKSEEKLEIDPPIETFFMPIEIPTPTPTQGASLYQAPIPVQTPKPTIDPYWTSGPWGDYVYG